jgi:hypothetical protein
MRGTPQIPVSSGSFPKFYGLLTMQNDIVLWILKGERVEDPLPSVLVRFILTFTFLHVSTTYRRLLFIISSPHYYLICHMSTLTYTPLLWTQHR